MSETVQSPDDLDESEPYQVMPAMDEDALAGLKEDIRENGVEDPVHIDENGEIIDGHHRVEICDELGIDDYPTKIHVGLTDQEKRDLAYRLNLQQRHLEHGQKKEVVEQYLIDDWDGVETQVDIAEKLGVGQQTVSDAKQNVISELDVFETTTENSSRTADDSGEIKSEEDKQDGSDESDSGSDSVGVFTTTAEDRFEALDLASESETNDEAEDQLEKVSRGENTVDSAKRAVQRDRRNKKRRYDVPDLPDDEYSVILADPPWESTQVSHDREIENHYRTMSLSEIKEMEIPAADESVLYLWTTGPKLEESVDVLNEWGFTYTTCAVWDKQKIGLGYWFRNQHELILIGKRGEFSPPAQEDRVSSVISAERGEHSEKPDELHEIIESSFPDHEKIELFARNPRDGWDSWGDEV